MNDTPIKSNDMIPSRFHKKTWIVAATISPLLILLGYFLGINLNKSTAKLAQNEIVQTQIPGETTSTPSLEFSNNFPSNTAPFVSPSFASLVKKASFTQLQCISNMLDNADYDIDNKILNSIKKISNSKTLVTGLENIYNHDFEYLAKSYQTDGKTIDKEKNILVKAKIKLLSICKAQESYYILYNANISWDSIDKELFSLIPQVNAAGGPQFSTNSYISLIDSTGNVTYTKLTDEKIGPEGSSFESRIYTPISTTFLKSSGYEGERRLDMLYPHKILGKIDDDLLVTFETKCYECHDNPTERSLYSLSLDPLKATEISFCKNYESLEQECFDKTGKYITLN
jgi:hypothetical protein